jgi:predicted PurR-regulated permease PerM
MKIAPSLNLKNWLALLLLGLVLRLVISHFSLVLQTVAAMFAGFILSLVLRVPAGGLEKRFHIPRVLSVSVMLLLVLLLPFLFLSLLFPFADTVIATLLEGAEALLTMLDSSLPPSQAERTFINAINSLIDSIAQSASEITVGLVDLLTGTITQLGNFLLMLGITTVFGTSLAIETDLGERLLRDWTPPAHWDQISQVMKGINLRLSQWAVSQLITMVFFAVAFGIGLRLLGVPSAAQIAVFGGFWEMIPGLGAVIALLLASLSVFATGKLGLLGGVLILYLVVTILRSSFLSPIVFDRRLRIHPMVMVTAVAVGIRALSYWGAFFAVPVIVVFTVVVQEILASQMPSEAEAPVGEEG